MITDADLIIPQFHTCNHLLSDNDIGFEHLQDILLLSYSNNIKLYNLKQNIVLFYFCEDGKNIKKRIFPLSKMFKFEKDEKKNLEDLDIIKYENKWKNMSINEKIETFQRTDILQYSVDLFPECNNIMEARGGKIGICANPECPQITLGYRAVSKLKLCSQCQVVRYCSVQCQKKHWKKHKNACKRLVDDHIFFNSDNLKKANKLLMFLGKNEFILKRLKNYMIHFLIKEKKIEYLEDIGHLYFTFYDITKFQQAVSIITSFYNNDDIKNIQVNKNKKRFVNQLLFQQQLGMGFYFHNKHLLKMIWPEMAQLQCYQNNVNDHIYLVGIYLIKENRIFPVNASIKL